MSYRKRRPSGDRDGDGGDHASSADRSTSYNSRQHDKSATPPSPSPSPPPQQISLRSSTRKRRSNSYDPIKVGYPLSEQKDHRNDRRPHDRALVRAINSELKMTKDYKSDPGKTLFIGRLNSITTEATLRKHFERFGGIRSLFLIKDVLSGESRRYAFVEFRRTKEADRAYSQAHNTIIDGRRILVDREHGRNTKEWKPRRFGGGYGGYKESGQIRFGGRSATEHHRPPPRNDNHHYRGGDRTRSMQYPSTTRRFNGFQPHSSQSSSSAHHHHDHDDDRHHQNNNHTNHHHHHHHHHASSPSPRSSRGSAMQYSSNGGGDGGSYRRHSSAAGPIRNRR